MKYKVGDKVLIVKERTVNMDWDGKMEHYLNTIMTIASVNSCNYCMKEDGGRWTWASSDIVGIASSVPLNKNDLQTGMKVVLRNGGKYLVLLNTNNGDLLCDDYGFMWLKDYDLNLKYNENNLIQYDDEDWDIVKVFQISHENKMLKLLNDSDWEIVWEEQTETQITEITMQEIADLKGVPVKSIRVKE